MAFGLDYVSGPSIADMKAAGVGFVCRYLSEVNPQTQVKLLTPNEAKALSAAGIAIVSNYEWYATRSLEGVAAGVYDARIAEAQHAACGGSASRPIYFSVDVDVSGGQVVDYFKGIASVIGLARTGAYGSFRVLQALFSAGVIAWGWQTYAWSGGAWEPRAHIQQYQNGMVFGGASVDYNRSIKSDFGQWLEGQEVEIVISIQNVAGWFTEADANHWVCKQTGKVIQFGILDTYKRYGNFGLCGLAYLGLPVSNEIPLDAKGNVKQHFERGVLFYDPAHVIDNPPGAGAVYAAHLYLGAGQDPAIANLEAQLAAAQKLTGLDPAKVANRLQAIELEVQKVVTLATQPL
jgi:hypothetical protein